MGKSHNGHTDLGLSHITVRVLLGAGAMLEARRIHNKALNAAKSLGLLVIFLFL